MEILEEIFAALDDPNGLTQDMWLAIVSIVGDYDSSVSGKPWNVNSFGGRYYLTDPQRQRLKHMIPFMVGAPIGPQQLALPPHVETEHPEGIRCGKCKGPFHPATGHAFSATIVACGICYGRFAAWQLQKYGWAPLTSKQIKKLDKRKNKAARKAANAEKALVKQHAREEAKREKLYGKPRVAQTAYRSETHTAQNLML